MLPNFLCVGAQKSGTTKLHSMLRNHPEIYLPRIKEPHFFDNEKKYARGLKWYEEKYFSEWKGEKAVGEITPAYMYFDKVPKRIKENLGKDIKFIFLLRNPVDRAYSQYWMSVRLCFENKSFKEAILLEEKRLKDLGPEKGRRFAYIKGGFYDEQIKNFLKFFQKEQMLFITFEEFTKDMKLSLEKICEFLGVSTKVEFPRPEEKVNQNSIPRIKLLHTLTNDRKISKFLFPNRKVRRFVRNWVNSWNLKPYEPPPMDRELKEKLIRIFKPHIYELEKIIEKDLSHWLEI